MTKSDSVSIAADQLQDLVARLFVASGLSADAARLVSSGLVEADLEGLSSHGVMLTDMYVERIRSGSVSTGQTADVVSDHAAAVVLDAGNALGHLTADQAMAISVERARRFAAGVVAVRHAFHFGTARRYALQAAAADCIGIVACNTRPLMPAPGGAERLVGNNPLAIAIPTAGPIPIVLDMATSEAAMGKIRMAEKSGIPIPPNWAVRSDGSSTTDPGEAIGGMLLPSGGPKGFGLAFVLDLMCGLLSGGAIGNSVHPLYGDFSIPYDCSHLFIALDVAHFVDPATFRAAAEKAADRVRASRGAAGVAQLFAPGEPEWRNRQQSGARVRLDAAIADMLVRYARDLGVSAVPLAADEQQTMKDRGNAEA